MTRRPLNLLAALSLLLLAAVAAVWVRSYWVCDSVARYREAGDPKFPSIKSYWISDLGQGRVEFTYVARRAFNGFADFGMPSRVVWTWERAVPAGGPRIGIQWRGAARGAARPAGMN